MSGSTGGAEPPVTRIEVPAGQGVQVGDHNTQHIKYIQTYVETQVIKPSSTSAARQVPVTTQLALAQLPGAVVGFTGRDSELAVLAKLLDPASTAESVVVSAVAGLAGVGKTTLTVEAGHAARRQGWFPGGVVFIDLHGYEEVPVQPKQRWRPCCSRWALLSTMSRLAWTNGPRCTGRSWPRPETQCW